MEKSEVSSGESPINFENAYIKAEDRILDPTKLESSSFERLPSPTGGRGKTDGGVLLPDAVIERESVATVCGYVLKAGLLAYKDTEKFPNGPWCKEKDWVIFGRYAGARFKIDGGEVRILNDDEVIAVIQDPDDILHF
jgi:co-chaperonin GroES (HSP10)